ncbi:MAG: prenyltransferase [Granulosicoccaceae bacterium]
MRPAFLLLTPVCVLLGVATAYRTTSTLALLDVLLVVAGAILAHISVNTFNEYYDFRSGLDYKTTRTAFSGGSGALVDRPDAVNAVLYLAVMALLMTIAIGVYFMYSQGLVLLPIGVIGVLIILSYTQWLNHHPLLCLLAPGTGFGPVMVVGTHVALTGEYSVLPFAVSLVPFFLVNNLLLFNQYPDMEADRSVGRNHFPIAYGKTYSNAVYAIFMLAACLGIGAGIVLGYFPGMAAVSLVPMLAAFVALVGMVKYASAVENLPFYLGMNVVATLLTPLFLGVALFLA